MMYINGTAQTPCTNVITYRPSDLTTMAEMWIGRSGTSIILGCGACTEPEVRIGTWNPSTVPAFAGFEQRVHAEW